MVDIVQTLCSYSTTNLNMLNGMGLTPLLCAVKNHGVLEEESQKGTQLDVVEGEPGPAIASTPRKQQGATNERTKAMLRSVRHGSQG